MCGYTSTPTHSVKSTDIIITIGHFEVAGMLCYIMLLFLFMSKSCTYMVRGDDNGLLFDSQHAPNLINGRPGEKNGKSRSGSDLAIAQC